MAAQPRRVERPRHPAEMGLLTRAIHGAIKFVSWLVLALIFSILLEWAAMFFFWRDEGPTHSRAILARELSYLNEDLRQSLFVSRPAVFAAKSGQALSIIIFSSGPTSWT